MNKQVLQTPAVLFAILLRKVLALPGTATTEDLVAECEATMKTLGLLEDTPDDPTEKPFSKEQVGGRTVIRRP